MKKWICISLLALLLLTATSCGPNVFKGGATAKKLILRKTTSIYMDGEGYNDTPVTATTLNYNEKGLVESFTEGLVSYEYDAQGNPVSIMLVQFGEQPIACQLENVYEKGTVKEVRITLPQELQERVSDPDSISAIEMGLMQSLLSLLENGTAYADARISVLGTQVYLVRSGGETLRRCFLLPGGYQDMETHKNEDGSQWTRVTIQTEDYRSVQMMTYDAMVRLVRMETEDTAPLDLTYTEEKDAATGHTVYRAEAEGTSVRYEFDGGRMLLQEISYDVSMTRQVTTYTADGQIAMFEVYRDGNLFQRDTYEYR